MPMRTYDEMIAGLGNMGETLMHFNEKHDSKGRFAKKSGGGGSSSSSSKNMIGPQRKDPFLGVSLEWVGDSQRFGIEEFGTETGMSPEDIDYVYANPPAGWGINDVSEVVGSGIAWSIRTLVSSYMESPAYSHLMNGEYHTEQEFLTGSAKLADRVYADMCNMFKSSEVISEYLKSDEGKAEVVEIVGSQLGELFANQTAPTPQETLNAKKRKKTYQDASHKTESKGVQRREITRDDVKKEYPDLPAVAIDSIYNSLSDKHKKVKGAAGNTDRVKHDDMPSVLAHFNPNHDPRNGRFAKGSIGDRIEKRHLEKTIERADRKMQRKQRRLDKIETRAEMRAYSPLSNYDTAEKILGEGLRKRVRRQEFRIDKAARTGAKAYARLVKYWDPNTEISSMTHELGKKQSEKFMKSYSDIKMASLYKALGKEYNATLTLPFDAVKGRKLEEFT